MSADEKQNYLLRDIPGDLVAEIDRRAAANFRSRNGEILAILTAVCRVGIGVPDLAASDAIRFVPAPDCDETAADESAAGCKMQGSDE